MVRSVPDNEIIANSGTEATPEAQIAQDMIQQVFVSVVGISAEVALRF